MNWNKIQLRKGSFIIRFSGFPLPCPTPRFTDFACLYCLTAIPKSNPKINGEFVSSAIHSSRRHVLGMWKISKVPSRPAFNRGNKGCYPNHKRVFVAEENEEGKKAGSEVDGGRGRSINSRKPVSLTLIKLK